MANKHRLENAVPRHKPHIIISIALKFF